MNDQDESMTGKVCLVTGATSGIGEATARELARHGAKLVIVGRNEARCRETALAIQRDTGNQHVEFLCADLSAQADIRRLAREFLDRQSRLHVLVNNAGAMFSELKLSADGIEMTLALNHLGYFLLTNLLLETLKASAPARIINVSSHAHDDVKQFDFRDLEADPNSHSQSRYGRSRLVDLLYTFLLPTKHPGFLRYAQSKLANLLFSYELARRLQGTGVTVNALHPGFVATNFMSGNGIFGWFMRRWASLVAIDASKGAQTSIYLATSPEVEGVSGKYFVKRKPISSSRASHDEADARRLWQISERLTKITSKIARNP